MSGQQYHCDSAIIGGGIAGLVTALELLQKGQAVLVADRDTHERIGGLARCAFGGMALVGTPEQKRLRIADSPGIALRDWHSFAEFDARDYWPKAWAEAYVNESREMVYDWVRAQGLHFFPAVNWVERGLYTPGNSLPRYHVLWGTGEHLVNVIVAKLQPFLGHKLTLLHRHRVDALEQNGGNIVGFRGVNESNDEDFIVQCEHTIVATGGINGTVENVRKNWLQSWGNPPDKILNGAHIFADGKMHEEVARKGGQLTHLGKMWNYASGIPHPQPHFEGHGLSLIPCKSALWLDHNGTRIGPDPLVTGFDTHYLCKRVCEQEKSWTWQLLNWRIAARELAVSGSEHNIHIRDRKLVAFLKESLLGNHRLVRQLCDESEEFIVADTIKELTIKMNARTDQDYIDEHHLNNQAISYDRNISRPARLRNDDQIRRIEHARSWFADRARTCKPAAILDPGAGPLIAIRMQLLSRKSLGGIQTNLQSQALSGDGVDDVAIPGLYAVGEAAGFGGGGVNGARSLEGTFLSGCIHSARHCAQSILS